MTKKAMRQLLQEAAKQQQLINIYMKYDENYYNLIPIEISERLFWAIDEDDFIFDGFRISQIRDIKALRIKNDKCDEIVRREGLFNGLDIPAIKIDSWYTVFESLQSLERNIIVEYETPEGVDDTFTIGRVVRVCKSCIYMYHFDADGIWQPKPYRIPYTEITSVTFASRYVDIFSKYLEPLSIV